MGKFDFLGNEQKNENKSKTDNEKTSKKNNNLDEFLKNTAQRDRFFPCPEMERDHFIWGKLLAVAWRLSKKNNSDTHSRLLYLRIYGCRIKLLSDHKSKIKLDLENSKKLLEHLMGEAGLKEKLEKLESGDKKQLAMFNAVGNNDHQRKKNIDIKKEKEKLYQQVVDHIKKEYLKPDLANIKQVFEKVNKSVKKAEKDIGIGYFNLNSLNKYYKKKLNNN